MTKPGLLQLIAADRDPERDLIGIDGARCVHAHLHSASCTACVDICPQHVWTLDDDALGLNAANCDACGLCVAACPPTAILLDPDLPSLVDLEVRVSAGLSTVFASCDQVDALADHLAENHTIACIQAVGLRQLLKTHGKGARQIVALASDCESCSRGHRLSLDVLMGEVNPFLEDHDLPPMVVTWECEADWQQQLSQSSTLLTKGQISRRSFFKRAAVEVVEQPLLDEEESAAGPLPPAKLLKVKPSARRFPFVPLIDVSTCSACDACIRVCPEDALKLINHGGGNKEYQIDAAACSGCQLCVDLCDQNAISVSQWADQTVDTIALHSVPCRRCGVAFNQTVAADEHSYQDVCGICKKIDHSSNLFQTL